MSKANQIGCRRDIFANSFKDAQKTSRRPNLATSAATFFQRHLHIAKMPMISRQMLDKILLWAVRDLVHEKIVIDVGDFGSEI